MPKYPQVARLFAVLFGDEDGRVGPDKRKRIITATGVTDPTVSRWVTGEARPDSAVWTGLAEAAGVEREVIAAALSQPRSERPTVPERDDLSTQLAALAAQVDGLTQVVEQLYAITHERLPEHVDLVGIVARLDAVEARLNRPPSS